MSDAVLREAILALTCAQTEAASRQARAHQQEEKKSDELEPTNKLRLHDFEYTRLLTMCGLVEGQDEDVPEMWHKLAVKGLPKAAKNAIIREAFQCDEAPFPGSPIPLVPQLLTVFRERAFHGDYDDCTVTTATKGLTPFMGNKVTEEEVARWTADDEALDKATSTTVQDYSSANKIKAVVPSSFFGLLDVIHCFSNLLDKGFGPCCPLLQETARLSKTLARFSENARKAMTKHMKATILWTLLLQTRHFASGRMDGGKDHLVHPFARMMDAVESRENYHMVDVPPELFQDKTPEKPKKGNQGGNGSAGAGTGTGGNPLANPKDLTEPAKWDPKYCGIIHPKLKAKLGFLEGKKIRVVDICKPCGTSPMQLFKNNNKVCQKSALTNWCHVGCTREHTQITDAEAEHVLATLAPIIDDPSLVQKKVRSATTAS